MNEQAVAPTDAGQPLILQGPCPFNIPRGRCPHWLQDPPLAVRIITTPANNTWPHLRHLEICGDAKILRCLEILFGGCLTVTVTKDPTSGTHHSSHCSSLQRPGGARRVSASPQAPWTSSNIPCLANSQKAGSWTPSASNGFGSRDGVHVLNSLYSVVQVPSTCSSRARLQILKEQAQIQLCLLKSSSKLAPRPFPVKPLSPWPQASWL